MGTQAITAPVYKLIEEAMLAQLRAAQRPYAVKSIESYAGQLDDDAWEWLRGTPAVWVSFVGAPEVTMKGSRTVKVNGKFMVAAAQRNINNNAVARLGDAAEPGVYQLLEDNKLALWNQQLGLPIQPLMPGATRQLLVGRTRGGEPLAVYAQEFETWWMEQLPEPGATPDGELRSIYLNYFLQPDDATQDAQDQVTIS
jgi:phage gp37-like protein